ncbi:hypothetical protein ACJQWK_03701 [Exserohilum turcicum]|uniref:NmrA-like domain-containing protein n=1 Tax=Exserohilum turcicum (strain 28A) TaxID=671987 RepID=R0J6B4_EXST2|nr:uncharacterized protein SETTUDRAFT_178489 [Exserohilum turcica Et28A]EOA92231.1 hypothetical protein SETTUDRAFT_178489 [Exserohilum turcica Et28A]
MVRIAVAGGTGNVATNLLKSVIASNQHDITILTRSAPSKPHASPKVSYLQVDYTNRGALTTALRGFHTVLSFFVVHLDVDNVAQKNLIHASIAAGVTRFAPSEWGIANGSGVASYDNKDYIRRYLEDLDAKGELNGMQYCLFQPSIFMDYFAHPYPLERDLITWPFFIDFENRRAMVLDAGDQPLVLTAIQDDAEILALALADTARPWPRIGGIRGCRTSINELIALGKKIRGGEWTIDHISSKDVESGDAKFPWVPLLTHPTIPTDMIESFSKQFLFMFFTAIARGAWNVSGELNDLFPHYKFMSADEYLTKAWEGRP